MLITAFTWDTEVRRLSAAKQPALWERNMVSALPDSWPGLWVPQLSKKDK